MTATVNPNNMFPSFLPTNGGKTRAPATLSGTTPASIPGLEGVIFDPLLVNATYPICDNAVGIDFESGYFSIIFSGSFTDILPERFLHILEDAAMDSYNFLSGGCNDIFQQLVMKAHLFEQMLTIGETEPAFNDLWTYFLADLRCNGCPQDNPLFDEQNVGNKRSLQSISIGGENYDVHFVDFLAELLRRIQLEFDTLAHKQ